MKRLGLVARADNGGIANQTWQFARRMKPERILIVHSEHTTRGRADASRYELDYGPEVRVIPKSPRKSDARWLAEAVDSIFTVECWYGPELPLAAKEHGVQTVLQGNPEITGIEPADVVWAPTNWRTDLLPGAPALMPFPTDLELMPQREFRGEVKTLYHVHSDAMCDRNGTQLLLEACGRVNHEIVLKIRGGKPKTEYRGMVKVEWLGHFDGMFYDHWPLDIDAFVMPRRYGGLSLPMQEAASLGLPIIATDAAPQRSILPTQALILAKKASEEPMRGGWIDIIDCSVPAIASKINQLVEQPHYAGFLAERCHDWAKAISWESLLPHYEATLR